jgi:transcriptional regulatory protein RtcR
MPLPLVVFGLLGTTLDRGGRAREERWRPTPSLLSQADLPVARLEMWVPDGAWGLSAEMASDLAGLSPNTELRRHPLPKHDPWDLEAVYDLLASFFANYPFDRERERYALHITTGSHIFQICLFLLAESHQFPGHLLQTSPSGADRVRGQVTPIHLDLSRYDRIAGRFEARRIAATGLLKDGIETRSPKYNALIDRMERVCLASPAPILLMGPTGAGKSHLARRIYELKRQRTSLAGAFVELNCATLRGDAAMSTLFGHVKGAYTGALSARPGLLRAADKGLLFLDEIGELGLDEQAMLLRAIEEGRFLPVGADTEARSNFQLIAGTNRDLRQRVRTGDFREDLLARIDTWTFRLPSLRERPEDLEPNLNHELDRFARSSGRRVEFNREARERFLEFARSPNASWNGNFRDLGAAVLRMATLSEGGRVDVRGVEEEIERLREAWSQASSNPDTSPASSTAAVHPTRITGGESPNPPTGTRAHGVASNGPQFAGTQTEDDPLIGLLSVDAIDNIDLFDLVQLRLVVQVCRSSESLSAAGRTLFAASRARRASVNDADRLRKYLARFELDWERIRTIE